MSDKVCKVCFDCGRPFGLLRRRHHCRLCGQIFCQACSSRYVDGRPYNLAGHLRVCEHCYDLVHTDVVIPERAPPVLSTLAPPRKSDAFELAASEILRKNSLSNQALQVSPVQFSSLEQPTKLAASRPLVVMLDGRENGEQQPSVKPSNASALRVEQPEEKPRKAETMQLTESRPLSEVSIPPTQKGPILSLLGKRLSDIPVPVTAHDLRRKPFNNVQIPATLRDTTRPSPISVNFPQSLLSRTPSLSPPGSNTKESNPYILYEEHFANPLESLQTVNRRHLRFVVNKLVGAEHLHQNSKRWAEKIMELAIHASERLKPNVMVGDQMDVCTYLKVKTVPGGRPSDSTYINGVVFRKSVAHKNMRMQIHAPRILLLACAIEFQRVAGRLTVLDSVLEQEKEFIQKQVHKILLLKPDVIVVQQSVCRLAQDLLREEGISLILNVKPSILQRLSRATGAPVVPSTGTKLHDRSVPTDMPRTVCSTFALNCFGRITFSLLDCFLDYLETGSARGPLLGACGSFRVVPTGEDSSAVKNVDLSTFAKSTVRKKRNNMLIYFEDCDPSANCTICLRGGSKRQLKKIKKVLRLATLTAYNLILETNLLYDLGTTYPVETMHEQRVTYTEAPQSFFRSRSFHVLPLRDSSETANNTHSEPLHSPLSQYSDDRFSSSPSSFESRQAITKSMKPTITPLSMSPFVPMQPVLVRLQEQSLSSQDTPLNGDKVRVYKTWLHRLLKFGSCGMSKDWPCFPPENKEIDFYSDTDKALGQYLLENCFDLKLRCLYSKCKRDVLEHQLAYTHDQTRILITVCAQVDLPADEYPQECLKGAFRCQTLSTSPFTLATGERLLIPPSRCSTLLRQHSRERASSASFSPPSVSSPSSGSSAASTPRFSTTNDEPELLFTPLKKPAAADATMVPSDAPPLLGAKSYSNNVDPIDDAVIWVWNWCKVCRRVVTPRRPMTERTFNISFGKFLDILFYNKRSVCHASECKHPANRQHVRYFAYNGLIARLQCEHFIPYKLVECPRLDSKLHSKYEARLQRDARVAILLSDTFFRAFLQKVGSVYSRFQRLEARTILKSLRVKINHHWKTFNQYITSLGVNPLLLSSLVVSKKIDTTFTNSSVQVAINDNVSSPPSFLTETAISRTSSKPTSLSTDGSLKDALTQPSTLDELRSSFQLPPPLEESKLSLEMLPSSRASASLQRHRTSAPNIWISVSDDLIFTRSFAFPIRSQKHVDSRLLPASHAHHILLILIACSYRTVPTPVLSIQYVKPLFTRHDHIVGSK